ncbi:hypothetical protein ABFT80_14335 [Mesorhizobium sp. SB112]|uniref:hypothetical protein n=1 Tax=Mesorhizobium sp. SB112 TaxID=3151853 RepID=UPI003263C02F
MSIIVDGTIYLLEIPINEAVGMAHESMGRSNAVAVSAGANYIATLHKNGLSIHSIYEDCGMDDPPASLGHWQDSANSCEHSYKR